MTNLVESVGAGQGDQIFVSAGKQAPKCEAHGLVTERAGDCGIEDDEFRIDPDLDCVGSQQVRAEPVKRADRRGFQCPEHHAPALDFMPRAELSAAKASNSLAELTGRLFGKGQGDQGTKRATLLAIDLAPVPLGQDKSLATTCAGSQGHAGLCHFKSVKLFSSQPRGGVLGIIHRNRSFRTRIPHGFSRGGGAPVQGL